MDGCTTPATAAASGTRFQRRSDTAGEREGPGGRFVAVSPDGRGFVDSATGRSFVPVGCNYFDPQTGWAPKVWSQYDDARVRGQFHQIVDAGLNTIRVFLATHTLSPVAGSFDESGFAKVGEMIAAARDEGLRIIFSGPNIWEGPSQGGGGDFYGDPAVLERRCELWRELMRHFGEQPTIMAWDLHNEPQVHWPQPEHSTHPYFQPRLRQWQRYAADRIGRNVDTFVSIHPSGCDRSLYRAYVGFQEWLTEQWVAAQSRAIREAGARQLITLGLHQTSVPIHLPKAYGYAGFHPRLIARHLDYTSAHFYPFLPDVHVGMVEPMLTIRRGYLEIICRAELAPGKPLVIEEFGWKGGSRVPSEQKTWPQEHQSVWGDALMQVTQGIASGWLNWGYADSPAPNADISAASGLWTSDGQLKHWGRRFLEHAAQLKGASFTPRAAAERHTLDLADFLYDHNGQPDNTWLEEHCAKPLPDGIEVVFEPAHWEKK